MNVTPQIPTGCAMTVTLELMDRITAVLLVRVSIILFSPHSSIFGLQSGQIILYFQDFYFIVSYFSICSEFIFIFFISLFSITFISIFIFFPLL
jgi:hypothetical protein